MVDRLTLLRIGAQATTSSRGRVNGVGGRCRTCSKDIAAIVPTARRGIRPVPFDHPAAGDRRAADQHSEGMESDSSQMSEQDDWLAGAEVAANAQDINLGEIDVSLDGLEPPDGPYVA
jgi:hypothetical protein